MSKSKQGWLDIESKLKRIAVSLTSTPMTRGPGAACGWTGEGYKILMSQPPGTRMELDVDSIRKLYRYAARMAHKAKVLRSKLDCAQSASGNL